jgi:hypothetical protein
MQATKPDCEKFKSSVTAEWICYWWELEEETGARFCSRPEWEENHCKTAGHRNHFGYQVGNDGEPD